MSAWADVPRHLGCAADMAKVTHFDGRVLLLAADMIADERAVVSFTPDAADALADAIRAAAAKARDCIGRYDFEGMP